MREKSSPQAPLGFQFLTDLLLENITILRKEGDLCRILLVYQKHIVSVKFSLTAVNPVTFHEVAVAEGGKRLWRLGKAVEPNLKSPN